MLIATYAVLMILFGSGGLFFDVFEDALKEEIEDKGRRKELSVVIDRANDVMETYREEFEELAKEMGETTTRYDATRSEVDAIATRADVRRLELTNELLDARFALRDKLSAEEWAAMYKWVLKDDNKP